MMQKILDKPNDPTPTSPARTALTQALNKLAFNYVLPPSQYFFRDSDSSTSIKSRDDNSFFLETNGQSQQGAPPNASNNPVLRVQHEALIKVYHIPPQTDTTTNSNPVVDEVKEINEFRSFPLITDYTYGYRWVAACPASWLNDNPLPSQIPTFANFPNSTSTNNATATIDDVTQYIKENIEDNNGCYVFI